MHFDYNHSCSSLAAHDNDIDCQQLHLRAAKEKNIYQLAQKIPLGGKIDTIAFDKTGTLT